MQCSVRRANEGDKHLGNLLAHVRVHMLPEQHVVGTKLQIIDTGEFSVNNG